MILVTYKIDVHPPLTRWCRPAGFDGNSQYDRFLLRATSRDPGRSRCR